MHGEEIEAEAGDRRLDPHLAGVKPVLQLAAVEHQLQRADPEAERDEAEKVERLAMHVSGLADKHQDAERAQPASPAGGLEKPEPAVILRQPAAEHRPHDWAQDRAD